MSYQPTKIELKSAEKTELESWVRSTTTEQRRVFRAKIILMANEGMGTNDIARRLETRAATVTKWRTRFARSGMDGLKDAPRPGEKGDTGLAGPQGLRGERWERRGLLALLERWGLLERLEPWGLQDLRERWGQRELRVILSPGRRARTPR